LLRQKNWKASNKPGKTLKKRKIKMRRRRIMLMEAGSMWVRPKKVDWEKLPKICKLLVRESKKPRVSTGSLREFIKWLSKTQTISFRKLLVW
jgi:hypothetical protein